jgi:hypothetical protein
MDAPKLSTTALALLSELLEDAEMTQSICKDIKPWSNRKEPIEELWDVYAFLRLQK